MCKVIRCEEFSGWRDFCEYHLEGIKRAEDFNRVLDLREKGLEADFNFNMIEVLEE